MFHREDSIVRENSKYTSVEVSNNVYLKLNKIKCCMSSWVGLIASRNEICRRWEQITYKGRKAC